MKKLKLPLPFKIRIDGLYNLKDTNKKIEAVGPLHKELQRTFRSHKPYEQKYEELRSLWVPWENKYNNFLGIEVECENAPGMDLLGWRTTEDGSLRDGGKEYISWILHEEAVGTALAGLYTILSLIKPAPRFSWRTSIHVHLNVRNFTIEEFLKLLLLYLAFEKVLFRFVGGEREKSNFCVPLHQSSLMETFRNFCNRRTGVGGMHLQWEKYSALNLSRLSDYGTVEFRHMPGTWEVSKLHLWIGMILSLSNAARSLSFDDLTEEFLKLNTTSEFDIFSKKVFGKVQAQCLAAASEKDFEGGITACKECLADIEDSFTPMKGSGLEKLIQKKVMISKREGPAQKKPEGEEQVKVILDDDIQEELKPFVFNWQQIAAQQQKAALQHKAAIAQLKQMAMVGNAVPVLPQVFQEFHQQPVPVNPPAPEEELIFVDFDHANDDIEHDF